MTTDPAEILKQLILQNEFMTQAQVCGLLNISQRTLDELKIPRYAISSNCIRYRSSDVLELIESKREK